MTSSGAPSAASATASGSPETSPAILLARSSGAFERLGEGVGEALGFGLERESLEPRDRLRRFAPPTGSLGPPSAAR